MYIDIVSMWKDMILHVIFNSDRFYDKTHNDWDDKESFVKVPGKYDLLEMDYEAKVWINEYHNGYIEGVMDKWIIVWTVQLK